MFKVKFNRFIKIIISQILYSTYHKLNGRIDIFILRLKKVFNLFLCFYVKICPI